ncbi:MAG: ATP phosphoribosyltransferase [Candidatus Melainabacteria bacterium]|nr:MAG: ATP phosphoribosyltransferase [Candidatus Melainabacteria bacterium]
MKPELSMNATIDRSESSEKLKLTLPTGHIQENVMRLLEQIGIKFLSTGRSYRPVCSDKTIETKMLKAQNIPSLVALGRHDCGFSGLDWIYEQQADVVELLDLQFDPVSIVVAMPEQLLPTFQQRKATDPPLIVASEYRKLSDEYIKRENLNAIFLHAYGATEALPPEDADLIIDNTSTGTTLHHNRLKIVAELMQSTTRFICNREVLKNPAKRKRLEEMTMLMESTIRAKEKVMLEMNVPTQYFDRVVNDLPCMRAPTISKLHNDEGYVVKIAVPKSDVPALIPKLVALGATDILEFKVEKIVI